MEGVAEAVGERAGDAAEGVAEAVGKTEGDAAGESAAAKKRGATGCRGAVAGCRGAIAGVGTARYREHPGGGTGMNVSLSSSAGAAVCSWRKS